jgi:AcrR family transcriptional regulator
MTKQPTSSGKKKNPMAESTDTATKLIEVAIELFSEHGFKGTSIRDIARMTGMTISSIYYYFGNKDGLLLAILDHSCKHLVETLRETAELDMEPLDRFKLLVSSHIGLVKVHKREAKIFFLDEEHLSPEGNERNRQFQFDILNIYRKQLRSLKALGYVKYRHITVLAFNILGVINWHLKWYRPEGPLPLEELTEEIVSFMLHGALGDPGGADNKSSRHTRH